MTRKRLGYLAGRAVGWLGARAVDLALLPVALWDDWQLRQKKVR